MKISNQGTIWTVILVISAIIPFNIIYFNKLHIEQESSFKTLCLNKSFSLSVNIADAVSKNEDLLMLSYLNKFNKEEDVIYNCVINGNGEVIAHTDANEIGKTYKPLSSKEILITDKNDENTFEINIPIPAANASNKFIIIGFSKNRLSKIISQSTNKILLLDLIILIMITIVSKLLFLKWQNILNKFQANIEMFRNDTPLKKLGLKAPYEFEKLESTLISLCSKSQETKSVENKSQETESPEKEQFRVIIQNIDETGILIADSDNKIIISNKRIMEILKQGKEITGKHLLEIFQASPVLELIKKSFNEPDQAISGTISSNLVKVIALSGKNGNKASTIILLKPL